MKSGYSGSNISDALLLRRNLSYYITGSKRRESTHLLNRLEYLYELDNVFNLYCSRFKWDLTELNVSDTYIDANLFYNAYMCFYNHPSLGWIILNANPTKWNIYNEPVELQLNGFDFTLSIPYEVNSEDAILIYDNPSRVAPFGYFSYYASVIADTARSCQVYANAMKSPTIIPSSFDKKKSAENFVTNINTNDPYVLVDSELFPDKDIEGNKDFKSICMPHSGDGLKALYMYKKSLYEELLTRLGIDNTAVRKEAQVSDDEVNKNELLTQIHLMNAYDCRKKAIARMIELSGKNIKCEVIEPLENEESDSELEDDEG